ncbi:MAG: glycosyltransferase family 2 protein [Puniceicoccaceae bacterium]
MKASLVSVIVPCFNYGEQLECSVTSALSQSYPLLEVIIIDDGSTDSTPEVASQLALKDSRVRVHHQSNQGVAAARNCGMKLAKGEWILFLDADDELFPEYLSKTVSVIVEQGCDFVYCDFEVTGETTRMGRMIEFDPQKIKIRNFVSICTLFRRNSIAQHHFDSSLEMNEDYDFVLGLVASGCVGFHLPEVLFRYRKHPDSRSTRACQDLKEYRTKKCIIRKHAAFFDPTETRLSLRYSRERTLHTLYQQIRIKRRNWDLWTRVLLAVWFSRSASDIWHLAKVLMGKPINL